MPIRINLLAEAQEAEEMRRRDPVKRSLWIGSSIVALVLIWCLAMQTRIMHANSEFKGHEARWKAIESKHAAITEDLKSSAVVERKVAALERLSTNRFLWGTTLDALQKTVVDQVQVIRLQTVQTFTLIDAVPQKKTSTKTTPAKPAEAIERISITIDARDWNPVEQNYNKFKEAIAQYPHFKTSFTKADALRLTSLSKPSFDPSDPARPFVMFTLEMHYPEISRNE